MEITGKVVEIEKSILIEGTNGAYKGSKIIYKDVSYIRDRRIPLELCPTSNLQTGAAKNIAQHPIGILAKLRFRVTLNTDNRLMSQTSMTHEMTEVVGAFKWDFADLQRVTINGMKSAFIPYPERLEIIEKIIKPGYAAIASE